MNFYYFCLQGRKKYHSVVIELNESLLQLVLRIGGGGGKNFCVQKYGLVAVEPILLVGDSSGAAHTFKLSPNLRCYKILPRLNESSLKTL